MRHSLSAGRRRRVPTSGARDDHPCGGWSLWGWVLRPLQATHSHQQPPCLSSDSSQASTEAIMASARAKRQSKR